MLASGVPAPEVARRAGHSVEVLLRVYAKCIDGQGEVMNRRIEQALDDSDHESPQAPDEGDDNGDSDAV